jgi:arginase
VSIAIIGAPWDASSSFQRGCAEAPGRIREALHSPSSNCWNERGQNLAAPGLLHDAGDISLPDDPVEARAALEAEVRRQLERGHKPLVLGGDHSITYPAVRGFSDRGELIILHLDAHADLYDEYDGDRYSHACPFTRILEEGLAVRLVQVGIRTLTDNQRSVAAKFGVEIVGADGWRDAIPLVARLSGSVYISLDLDVLEPGLAPGLSHPEPGGLAIRDVLDILSTIRATVVGADIVEYNPRNDVRDLTARVAAKFVKELVGVMREGA